MEQLFLDLESRWMTAWKNKDEAVARSLMADEFTLTSSLSTGDLVDKEDWIEKALNHYHCRDFTFKKVKTRVYDRTAVLNIWYHQDATANGKDWSGDFLITDIWVQKKDDWLVVARHASWLPNK